MRVLTSRFARAKGEEGATAVIVALCIVALFGMIVLVVDVGGLLLRRREMVNGADAAALAAAKTCVLASDARDPRLVADDWAGQNTEATVSRQYYADANCDAGSSAPMGYASVRYQAPQSLFFAPVLGYPSTGSVTTDATAIWGPPGSTNPMPLAIYTNAYLSNCDVEDVGPDVECYFWFDNTGFGTSRFGILDLREYDGSPDSGWNAPADTTSCGNVGSSELESWISGDVSLEVSLNYPASTYVCIRSGQVTSQVWGALESRVGDTLTFPINHCDLALPGTAGGQVNSSGAEVPCDVAPHKYDIIGFADFLLQDVLDSAAEWGGTPLTNCSRNVDIPAGPATVNLMTLGSANCPSGTPTSSLHIANLTVNGNPPGGAFTWIPGTTTFTWNSGPVRNADVRFDWWIDGQCGAPPGNASAVCVKVKTVEIRVGGSDPGGGSAIGNIRAYKLCEPTVAGSCDPVPVPVPPGS